MSCVVATLYSLALLVLLVAAIVQSHWWDKENDNSDQ